MNKFYFGVILSCVLVHPYRADAIPSPIGTTSHPSQSAVRLELVHRFQSYNSKPHSSADVFDPDIQSPKSVRFSKNGDRVFVNSLEGMKTVVYKTDSFKKAGLILHTFHAQDQALFVGNPSSKNIFSGKPVESALTNGGKYLWVPYYRRNFDPNGVQASAVAVVDTDSLKIVRVFETGPIAKYVFASPDGRLLVVSNWGNNTLTVFDIAHANPNEFHIITTLTVEHALDLNHVGGDRDKNCGFCLRGLAFSQDSQYLFVARMGGGGIAVFDMKDTSDFKYLGTVFGMKPTPRDLLLSPEGKSLYISSNIAGYISRIAVDALIAKAQQAHGGHVTLNVKDEIEIGTGARTIRLSKDGRYLFVALNKRSEVAVLDTRDFHVVSRIAVDSYPVGLDLSADGRQLWMTSQAKATGGGDAVDVFSVTYDSITAKDD